MYALRTFHPVHQGRLLSVLSVRRIVIGQATLDVRSENPSSSKILESSSIGIPRKQSLRTYCPRIEERDFAYIDEVSFLHLIIDVLTCFQELFTKSRASSGSCSLILCKGTARSTFRAGLHPLVRMSLGVYLGIANPALEKGSKSASLEHEFHFPADPCKHEQCPGIASKVSLTQTQKRESEKYHNVGQRNDNMNPNIRAPERCKI